LGRAAAIIQAAALPPDHPKVFAIMQNLTNLDACKR